MSTHPASQHDTRTKAALAAMLVLGNVFFFACVAGRCGLTSTDWTSPEAQPPRLILAME
ncbi:hypothetical protein [Roseicella aquatilis]|uniref:hypothetical protein n=1 Tax=Roseicella aquatilis TaxID=2527868 RepID=UPI001404B6DE|nr:hypothetical protein [Roseicella aquatilis]